MGSGLSVSYSGDSGTSPCRSPPTLPRTSAILRDPSEPTPSPMAGRLEAHLPTWAPRGLHLAARVDSKDDHFKGTNGCQCAAPSSSPIPRGFAIIRGPPGPERQAWPRREHMRPLVKHKGAWSRLSSPKNLICSEGVGVPGHFPHEAFMISGQSCKHPSTLGTSLRPVGEHWPHTRGRKPGVLHRPQPLRNPPREACGSAQVSRSQEASI